MAKRDWKSIAKDRAAKKAVDMFVKDGMVIGVGTGSTVLLVIGHLKTKIQKGWKIVAIPSSLETQLLLTDYGIPISSLDKFPELALTIDGADEVDPQLNLIKGGGAALFREKIIASAAKQRVIVVDSSKLVPELGTNWPIPIEVHPFALGVVKQKLREQGITPILRVCDKGKSGPIVTDNGGFILDGKTKPMSTEEVHRLDVALNNIPGVLGHGLFVNLTEHVIVGHQNKIQHLEAQEGKT
ncbi:MAG: ribose-5-phosphate isomerase RpiA [Candidatus Ranarchaeia archaeon]|jgi:ribose 5-phosphate isomerase A